MARCRTYCKKYNRQLLINTDRSGLVDDLSLYFYAEDPGITLGSEEKIKEYLLHRNGRSAFTDVYPHGLRTAQLKYDSVFDGTQWRERRTGEPLTFDFSTSYTESILVHEQYGGGTGIEFLEYLRLQPTVLNSILQRIGELGEYDAVHIRNTDYKTDYEEILRNIIPKARRPVVICTDDYQTQKHAVEMYGEKVRLTHAVPDVSAMTVRRLHDNTELSRYETNLNALTDLFVLASARRLHVTTLREGQSVTTSGFMMLALSLRKRKEVLIHLLSGQKLTGMEKTARLSYTLKQAVHLALKKVRRTTRSVRRKIRPKTL